MRPAAVVIGCLAIGILCFANARAAADYDARRGAMRSLKQGKACGNYDFKFNTDFPSDNPMNNGREAITQNSEECCALCNETEGCKTWTRIKFNSRHNRKGECWLRDHIPEETFCRHCDSGSAKSVDDFLDECENKGRSAGPIAARGACSSLISVCPPPTEDQKVQETAASDDQAFAERSRLEDVTNRTCKVLFENECQSAAYAAAFEREICGDILTYGPAPGAESCPDFAGALQIFDAQLLELCVSDDD